VRQPFTIDPDWLRDPELIRVVDAIEGASEGEGDEARVVGGPVRDAILGLPVNDIDIATTALPETVMERGARAGLKTVPTGIDHGTVTLIASGRPFEVTTLRQDVETFGRHAKVRFGTSWEADARRRDFTMNALFASLDGTVHDPIGGIDDCLARRVRFIGEPDERIREDWLRILRFFRFHAAYGVGPLDAAGLNSTIRLRDGLRLLSRERVGQEFRRLLVAGGAVPTLEAMSQAGILQLVLGGIDSVPALGRLVEIERTCGLPASFCTRLAVLAVLIEEDVERLWQRLRLTNSERDRVAAIVQLAPRMTADLDQRSARLLLYRAGRGPFVDAVQFAWARDGAAPENADWKRMVELPGRWPIPKFPLRGRDLMAEGIAQGPRLGRLLAQLERRWMEEGFTAGAEQILSWVNGQSVKE
jgi:poly(A) polymerase